MPNLADEITRQARLHPDAAALHLPKQILSFGELETRVWQAATELHRQGVRSGDIVALTFASEFALFVALLALARLGGTVFSLPRNWPGALRRESASRAGATVLLTDLVNVSPDGLKLLRVDIDALVYAGAPIDYGVRDNAPRAPFLLVTGSGSTGKPKVLGITHTQFYQRAKAAGTAIALSKGDRLMCTSALDFTTPKERYLAALCAGAATVLFDQRRFDPVRSCRSAGVTVMSTTVFHVESLLATLGNDAKQVLDFLRVLQVSASPVSDGLRRRIIDKLSPSLFVRYATNETGLISIARPDEVLNPPGTVGRLQPGVVLEVVDSQGRGLPPGETGLIRVKSPGMVHQYSDDEPATQAAFKDGWFWPGDLGRFGTDGQLIHCGRADHMMIMNGINIYPVEIEHVMAGHPAILDVVAIPLQSDIHHDIPVCAVTLARGQHVTEKSLMTFARERLGARGPRSVVVLAKIPRNERGKLLRAQVAREIGVALNTMNKGATKKNEPADAAKKARPRLRQPFQRITLDLQCPQALSLDVIDQWMNFALALDAFAGDPADLEPGVTQRAVVEGLLKRVSVLVPTLLQAARVPVFDVGILEAIQESATSPLVWTATLAVAKIDLIPVKCYSIAIQEAIHILLWAARTPPTDENRRVLHATIQKRVIEPVQRLMGAGKSTVHVLRAAYQLDMPFRHIGAGVYQVGWGSNSRRVDRSTTGNDSAIGSKLARNKAWTANLLRMAGLPAPSHELVNTPEDALRAAQRLGWPVVVKPLSGERGEGVTVGVADNDPLLQALTVARQASSTQTVIVERQVSGICHRLFIANKRLLYAVKRLPKSVLGDGRQTVAALVDAANLAEECKPPWDRTEPFPLDAAAIEAMQREGFSVDTVPQQGARVPLRNIESTQWGGFDEDVTDLVHPDNLDVALRAAALTGLNVAGVDIITPDIRTPWYQNGAIINEVNFSPLLGGGEISRRHIPAFLKDLVGGDGRIPIEVFFGGDAALDKAQVRQKALVSRGHKCFVTSHRITLQPSGADMRLSVDGLYARCRALLLNDQVDAVLMVIQTDELLHTGLPVDRIDQLASATGKVELWQRSGEELTPAAREDLLDWLGRHR